MANITLDELRAKYAPEDRDEYNRAYAVATLRASSPSSSTGCAPGRA